MRFTEASVKSISPPEKGRLFRFDEHRDAPRGFSLRITKAGGKAFVLHYKMGGYDRQITIGNWPTWSVVAARERACELVREIDRGRDPQLIKRQQRQDPRLEKVIEDFVELHVSGLKSAKPITAYLKKDLSRALGKLKPRDITR